MPAFDSRLTRFPLFSAARGASNRGVLNSRNVTPIFLVLLAVAAYLNSFSGAFVFDDIPGIRDNPTIRTLKGALSPPENSGLGGRPLANLSLALNHAIGGNEVRGYHAGNLVLHVASTLLLFGIIRRTYGVAKPETGGRRPELLPIDVSGFRSPVSGLGAAVAAAAWCVHPLTTAAVTYMSQRTELLMAFFHLLTLYAFIRGSRVSQEVAEAAENEAGWSELSPRPPVRSGSGWLVVSVLACALGMLSKEVMATAPVLVLMFDRTFVAGSFGAAWRRRRGYYVALAATWLVLGWVLTTGLAQRSVGFGLGVSPVEYALTECRAILVYLARAIWPASLVFDYGAIYSVNVVAAVVVVMFVAVAAFAFLRRSIAGFLAAAFLLLLAPTSTFVPVTEQPIAENRMYLPLTALLLLALHGVHRAVRSRPMTAAVAVLPLAALTVARNVDYQSELSLWTDTVAKRPENPRAQFNLGVALLDLGRAGEAARAFERSLALKPREPKAHNSLGNALLELGRVPEALPHFAEAVRLKPDYARAWYNYGVALLRQGDAGAAIERLLRSVSLDGRDAEVHAALGNAYFHLDRPADALPHYTAALAINPQLADVHYNAGSACLELGRLDEAVTHFFAAARLKPEDPEVRNNLGAALLRKGRGAEAIEAFEYALRLKPDYADAKSNLELAKRGPR